jgi:GntR family transcriptional repressor for pyruvate dehydrogenase complex
MAMNPTRNPVASQISVEPSTVEAPPNDERPARAPEGALRPVRERKMEDLYAYFQTRILSDEWAAGTRLPGERELAERFNTNRNTLREAIRRLEQSGLVSVRHGQGVTVSDFRRTGGLDLVAPFLAVGRDIREKAELMLNVLEPRKRVLAFAVERFVERFVASDLPPVEDALRAVREAESARDPRALIIAEARMYDALVEGTHDQIVRWLSRPLLELTQEINERWTTLVVFEPSLSNFASRLLAAAVARDGAQAVALMRAHYDAVDVNVRALLAPFLVVPPGAADLQDEETSELRKGVAQ